MEVTTDVRPEDDFESFMAMMGEDITPENAEEDVDDQVNDDYEEDEVEYDEEDALRSAMNEEDDEDVDEEDEDSEEDYEDEEETEDDEGDFEGVDVDFDTVITLPNGEQISIENLHKGYLSGDELKSKEEELVSRQTEYEERFKDIDKLLDTAKLEADRVLEDFKGFDWQELANKDPKDFANTKLFVEKYMARSKEIKAAQEERAIQREQEKQNEVAVKAKACVDILKADIPEWNSELYGEILQHAVDKLGMGADEAKNLVDPSVIKAIHRSLQLDKGTVKAKAKLKRVSSPKKVAKAGAKRTAKSKKATANYKSADEEFNFFKSLI